MDIWRNMHHYTAKHFIQNLSWKTLGDALYLYNIQYGADIWVNVPNTVALTTIYGVIKQTIDNENSKSYLYNKLLQF